ERREASGIVLRLRFRAALPGVDQAIVLRQLERQLRRDLRERGLKVGERLVAGQILAVGARPGYEPEHAFLFRLPAVGAIEPHPVADDAAAEIAGDIVEILQRRGGGEALRAEA